MWFYEEKETRCLTSSFVVKSKSALAAETFTFANKVDAERLVAVLNRMVNAAY